ncbi:MAG: hypothetical protein ACTH1Z_08425, partial [Ancrocorticia sp.]|uniref:hypothetical protein n=1 Tax=Ancrocorticia sp. TaxID=2593684 RepID=UPI003F9346C9
SDRLLSGRSKVRILSGALSWHSSIPADVSGYGYGPVDPDIWITHKALLYTRNISITIEPW